MKRLFALFFAATMLAAMPALAQKQYKVVNTVKLGGEGFSGLPLLRQGRSTPLHHTRKPRDGSRHEYPEGDRRHS